MKVLKKISALFCTAVIAASSAAVCLPAFAAEVTESGYTEQSNYYGKRLEDPVSKKFYNVLENMDFASGESVKIDDSAVLQAAAAYASGDATILDKFGAAVDSFRYDHTEYFYVDFDMLTINVARKGGSYTVEVGAGRSDSYLVEGFTANMVTEYETLLNSFVDGLALKAGATVKEKAAAVNAAVTKKVTYDFCNDTANSAARPYIRTAYGALKYGKAVCEGYSRVFKSALDKLGVTNVLINGWLSDGDAVEAHMWNNVLDGGVWYGADPTVADSANNPNLIMTTNEVLGVDHTVDYVVSSSGYNMPFPETSYLGGNGFTLDAETYNGKEVYNVKYEGLNYVQLYEQKGLYMAIRYATTNAGGDEWFGWQPLRDFEKMYKDYDFLTTVGNDSYLLRALDESKSRMQLAVLDANGDSYSPVLDLYAYTEEFFNDHVLAMTDENAMLNPNNNPEYIATPYVMTMNPMRIEFGEEEQRVTRTVTVKFTHALNYKSGSTPVIEFYATTSGREEDRVDVSGQASVENIKFDGEDTVTFTFKPSMNYSHDELTYVFNITNMVGKLYDGSDGKAPMHFNITVARRSYVCNKVYGDGRLYVKAYGSPTLVSNNDLSVEGWTYEENGVTKTVSQNQRSQLALVVKKPANKAELEEKVQNQIDGKSKITGTYEIGINICKNIAKIPDGSYMKLSFGFPEGYGPDDEGVEFEVYHFKSDGTTEVIPCVITKFGITVTVNSFSPFVLVAHEDANSGKKGIETIVNGTGGKVTTAGNKSVNFVEEGGSITYTLNADEGFKTEYVLLNDEKIEVTGNTVTLTYDKLKKNNTLIVGYAAESVLASEAAAGVENLNSVFYANLKVVSPDIPEPPAGGNGVSGGVIALIVIILLAAVAGGAVAVYFLVIKKRRPAKAAAGKKNAKGKK